MRLWRTPQPQSTVSPPDGHGKEARRSKRATAAGSLHDHDTREAIKRPQPKWKRHDNQEEDLGIAGTSMLARHRPRGTGARARLAGPERADCAADAEAAGPTPSHLLQVAVSPRRHWWGARRAAAAVVLAVMIGLGAGWLARGALWQHTSGLDALAQVGAELHRMAARGDVASSIELDRERLMLELRKALAHEVKVPDLEPMGLHLIGGRVLPIALGDAAAQLLDADDFGARFALYLVRPDPGTPLDFQPVAGDDIAGLAWAYEEFRCLLIGDAAPDRLLAISQAVRAELDADEAANG